MAINLPFALDKLPKFAAVIMIGLSSINLTTSSTLAQSSQCLNLQNQLNVITTGGRNTPSSSRYRQYDRAARDQRAQMQKTQRMSTRNGCNRRVFRQRNSGTCGRILSSLQQMQANLANLEQQKRRFAPRGGGGGNDRRAVIRAMQKFGCLNGSGVQRIARLKPRQRSLVEQVFGLRTFRNDGRRRNGDNSINLLSRSRSSTYRTLCVRISDGYYFPISFSTVPDRFSYDEEACQAKCPGAEVELYYHAIPSQDSEEMVSFRSQEPYVDLESAFSYRKKFTPGASCKITQSASNFEQIAGSNGEFAPDPEDEDVARIGKPVFQRDRTLDPETIASLEGEFDELEVARYSQLANGQDGTNGPNGEKGPPRVIRTVGSAFYPVQ